MDLLYSIAQAGSGAPCTEQAGLGWAGWLGWGLQTVAKQSGWSFLHPAAAGVGSGQWGRSQLKRGPEKRGQPDAPRLH